MKFAFCKHPSGDIRMEQEMSELNIAKDEEGWHLMTMRELMYRFWTWSTVGVLIH